MMPEIMTKDLGTTQTVTNLDGKVLGTSIERETTFPGCETTRACYKIEHKNIDDVPGGTNLRFKIGGTINQESVQTAGTFFV